MRDRQVLQPVPLHINNKYTLRRITDETAEIEILGTISPPVPYGSSPPLDRELRVVIREGKSQGQCRLDRRTGLPLDSHTEQALAMTVRMPDGSEFEQHKRTLTTTRLVLEPGSPGSGSGDGGTPPAVERIAQEAAPSGGDPNNRPRR